MVASPLQILARDGARSGHRIVTLSGAVTLETVPDFVRRIRAETGALVIVDFTEVPYVDSAGLGALVQAYVHFAKGGNRLVLAALNPRVKAVLEIMQLQRFFTVYANVGDAEKALG